MATDQCAIEKPELREIDTRDIKIAAMDGLYNMIHPDKKVRADGLRKLRAMASFCDGLGASVIALWAGSLNLDSQWGYHPDNHSPEAFNDLVVSVRQALQVAEEYGITLAIEATAKPLEPPLFAPQKGDAKRSEAGGSRVQPRETRSKPPLIPPWTSRGRVLQGSLAIEGGAALTPIHSAQAYRRLLDEVGSPLLKIKFDVGNHFPKGELPRHREILDEDFALLGEDIVIVDAKDTDRDGWCESLAPGQGLLDYDHVISLIDKLGWDVPVMMDGHTEDMAEFLESVAFVREKMQAINP